MMYGRGPACRQRRRPLSPLSETPFAACAASPFAGASAAGRCSSSSSSSASAAGDALHVPPIANTAATAADRRAAATVSSAPSPEDASRAAVCSSCPRVAATPRLRASKPRAGSPGRSPPFRMPSSSGPLMPLPPPPCGSGAADATAAVRPRTAASSCPGRSLSRSTCQRVRGSGTCMWLSIRDGHCIDLRTTGHRPCFRKRQRDMGTHGTQHLERLHCEAGADVARLGCW